MNNFNIKKQKVVSEINVTPLVDVMLVLLVIFMVTTPMLMNGIDLNLPETQEKKSVELSDEIIILSLTKENKLYLGEKLLRNDRYLKIIQDKVKKSKDKALFLRADESISYGKVAKLMGALRNGGISKISLITETERE